MKYLFAALRFLEDERIADKLYWYSCGFSLREGDDVLAPVGAHNCLQRATAERVLETDAAHAPYDMRLIKRVEARYGERRLAAGNCVCFELGGLRYDEKRYTRFQRILFSSQIPNEKEEEELGAYGVTGVLTGSAEELSGKGALAKGCVLLAGENAREAATKLLSCVRGKETDLTDCARQALIGKLC